MKVAYLLAPGVAYYAGKATGTRYKLEPWCEVDPADWPAMRARMVVKSKCCDDPARQIRVFGSEEEIANGAVGFNNR